VARDRRQALTAAQVMVPVSTLAAATPDDDLWNLVQRMGEDEVNQVPVVSEGRLMGLITRENLLNHIRLRSELAA
jgi:predicted transcriptional regulator